MKKYPFKPFNRLRHCLRCVHNVCVILIISLVSVSCADNESDAVQPSSESKSVAAALYKKNCKVCHAQGINGAPILGNKKMWASRAGRGVDVLVDHAENGYGLMPAKGGNEALTTEEIKTVVEYMLGELEK